MAGEAIKIMEDCARAVDAGPDGGGPVWQFFGASGNHMEDRYTIRFLSRGNMPPINPEDLGYMRDFVSVDSPDDSGESAPRMIIYEGPGDLVPEFTTLMRDKLLLPIDKEDPLDGFNGPLAIFGAAIRGAVDGGEASA